MKRNWQQLGLASALVLASQGAMAANIFTSFGSQLLGVFCELLATNGPLVPIIAAAALLIFFVLLILDEGKGYVSTLLRIGIGVAGIVFIPSFLNLAFGISLGC